MVRYRVRAGDVIVGFVVSSLAVTISGQFRIVSDKGQDEELLVDPIATGSSRALETVVSRSSVKRDGWLVGGAMVVTAGSPKRGQTYVFLWVGSAAAASGVKDQILGDYLYIGHTPTLGRIVDPGPGGGEGNMVIEALKADTAPAASTVFSAATNAFRKVYGFAWYYNASADMATRTLNARVKSWLGAVPTGYTQSDTMWDSATVTLTASEEGTMAVNAYPGGLKFIMFNDNTSLTYGTTNAGAGPFPIPMGEDNPVDVEFIVGAGHANDRDSIYVLYEEWLVI